MALARFLLGKSAIRSHCATPRKIRTKNRPPRTAIFELTALEQRVLLSVNAPAGLEAYPPPQTFLNAFTQNHPMTQMDLAWTDGGGGVSYRIYQSTDGANFVNVGQTAAFISSRTARLRSIPMRLD